jgi:hypothetical protein
VRRAAARIPDVRRASPSPPAKGSPQPVYGSGRPLGLTRSEVVRGGRCLIRRRAMAVESNHSLAVTDP